MRSPVLLLFSAALSGPLLLLELSGGAATLSYAALISVGSPARQLSVIVDTGSDLLSFPCDAARGHQHSPFATADSATFALALDCAVPFDYRGRPACRFARRFEELSSLSGFYATDFLRFRARAYPARPAPVLHRVRADAPLAFTAQDAGSPGGLSPAQSLELRTEFGCAVGQTGSFVDQLADGIMGLDNRSLFIRSLEQDAQQALDFSICFAKAGGLMEISFDSPEEQGPRQGFPFDPEERGYVSLVQSLSLAGELAEAPPFKLRIDTGTTFMHLPQPQLVGLVGQLTRWCDGEKSRCGGVGGELNVASCWLLQLPDPDFADEDQLIATFPPLALAFANGFVYRLQPQNYLYLVAKESTDTSRKVCLAVGTSQDGWATMGSLAMIDHQLVFDRRNKFVAVTETDCGALQLAAAGHRRLRLLPEVVQPAASISRRWLIALEFGSTFLVAGVMVLYCCYGRRKQKPLLHDVEGHEEEEARPRSSSF